MRISIKSIIVIVLIFIQSFIFAEVLPLSEFRNQTGDYTYHLGYMGPDRKDKEYKFLLIIALKPLQSAENMKDRYYNLYSLSDLESFKKAIANDPNLDFLSYFKSKGSWIFKETSGGDRSRIVDIQSHENETDKSSKNLSFTFYARYPPPSGTIGSSPSLEFKIDAIPEKLKDKWIIKENVEYSGRTDTYYSPFWFNSQDNPKKRRYIPSYYKKTISWIEIEFKKVNS